MSDTAAAVGRSGRGKLFFALAEALAALANRLTDQEELARDIADMAFRAEQIAARAMSINASGTRNGAAIMQDLAQELSAFAGDMIAHAARAAEEVAMSQRIGGALLRHSKLMAEHGSASGDPAVLRSHLASLLDVLVAVPGQLSANTALAQQMAVLADRADTIAARAGEAAKQRHSLNRAASDIYRDLRLVANDAADASSRMCAEATAIKTSAEALARRTARLSQDPAQPAAPKAGSLDAKLHDVIDRGRTIAAQRANVMDWSSNGNRSN